MSVVSPFAPSHFPSLPAISGVKIAVANTGIRYKNRPDLLYMVFDEHTSVAGVFTQNAVVAAPVKWCRDIIAQGTAKALIVNAGNANAYTGAQGDAAVKEIAEMAAMELGCKPASIYLASTGVIGEPLQVPKILKALPSATMHLKEDGWQEAATAIMTTDTFPKMVTCETSIGDTKVVINGITKGAGMIAPNMATLLSFIATDAHLSPTLLQEICSWAVQDSFNAISIDGDTSTNDTLLCFATGKANHVPVQQFNDDALKTFKEDFRQLMIELAQLIVRDGEGISKFITITVKGAYTKLSARTIALSIANSPLVKTAIAGSDANWGRIAMAVGKSGEAISAERMSIWIGESLIATNGGVSPFYQEQKVAEYMKEKEISITVDVGLSKGEATVWTCDLTHGYIDINADYRS